MMMMRMQALALSPADRRLLQEGRLTGPMPWIIAIMMFLTVIACAAGLGLVNASDAMDAKLAGRLTVQIVDADADSRERDAARVASELRALPGVARVAQADRAELARLLEPFLGKDGMDRDLPMPALIDVDLSDDGAAAAIESAVARIAPAARVDRHSRWLAPVATLFAWLTWLAMLMVLLMAAATAATVVLAARAALNTHKSIIEVLHMMGATDGQVAGLFQRRIAIDALFGGLVGLVAGALVVVILGGQLGSLESELAGGARLWIGDWLRIVLLPVAFALLATLVARFTILTALRRTL